MELDGFLYLTKNNNLIFVECKNSWTMGFDHLIQFIGKCTLLEKIYGIHVHKCLVSTGLAHPFLHVYMTLNPSRISAISV